MDGCCYKSGVIIGSQPDGHPSPVAFSVHSISNVFHESKKSGPSCLILISFDVLQTSLHSGKPDPWIHDLRIRIQLSTEEAVVHCCSGLLGPKIGFLQRFGRPSDGVAVTWMISQRWPGDWCAADLLMEKKCEK